MKKFAIYTVLLALFSCNLSMEEMDYDIRPRIKNNSEKVIYFGSQHNYPDTAIELNNPLKVSSRRVNPGETVVSRASNWEPKFNSTSHGIIMFFIYDDALQDVPWDTIKANYMILRRYDLTWDSLVYMNYIIEYP